MQESELNDQGFWVSTRIGRTILSALLALIVCCCIFWNVPKSESRRLLMKGLRPVGEAMGLSQNWRVFSPNPKQRTVLVHAEVHFANGSLAIFNIPRGGPVIRHFRHYHWRKWEARLRLDKSEYLWDPAARYVASLYADDPRGVARVVLVRSWANTREIGSDEPSRWKEFAFYVLDVPAAGDEEPVQPTPTEVNDG